jgi:hypothetical protein
MYRHECVCCVIPDLAREIIFNVRRDAEAANRAAAIDDIRVYMDTLTSLQNAIVASAPNLSTTTSVIMSHRRSSSSNGSGTTVLPIAHFPTSPSFDNNMSIIVTTPPTSSSIASSSPSAFAASPSVTSPLPSSGSILIHVNQFAHYGDGL